VLLELPSLRNGRRTSTAPAALRHGRHPLTATFLTNGNGERRIDGGRGGYPCASGRYRTSNGSLLRIRAAQKAWIPSGGRRRC